ncbi:MAG: hypothetical protein NC177_06175 [Ruminococcus flavefaciens]|nr:hypothetical protein [Ruminococcus flavefaciens]
MDKQLAVQIIDICFTDDVRNTFRNAIQRGYEKNSKKRLLYSAIYSCIESDEIKNLGFNAELEQYKSSYKTHIYNDKFVIDVFESNHNNNTNYDNKKTLSEIKIHIYDENINLIYEENL